MDALSVSTSSSSITSSDSEGDAMVSSSPPPTVANGSGLTTAAKALPEQVAKLAAANEMLRSSLQTAHKDIAQLLVQRDELTAQVRSTEGLLDEVVTGNEQWLSADMELTKRRQDMLKESLQHTRDVRARQNALLAKLTSPTSSAQGDNDSHQSLSSEGANAGAAVTA